MMPEASQDLNSLRWIRSDLDQTLREARTALEDFVDGQTEQLQSSIDHLHHVHGVLQMVQLYGAAMLADEMEQLAKAMAQGQVRDNHSAAEALMLGMVQLPAYLEKIESGRADVPLALLPVMNDLRAAHDAPLVSETSLFAPKLNAVIAAETVRPGSGNRDLPQLTHRQRGLFQRALLGWIRGSEVDQSLQQMRDVLDTLNSAAGTTRFRRLLDAAEALVKVLLSDEQTPAGAVKPLFGKLDRVFKQIIDQGEEAAMLEFPVELLKNILYYVARSNSTDPAVQAARESADVANAFAEEAEADDGALGGPDRAMFSAVGEALSQDLRDVKDHLDLFMRSDRGDLERITRLAQPIQRIGDTLGMVGRGDLRARLKGRGDELTDAQESGEVPAEDRLMALAADLLYVESSLANLGQGATGGAEDGKTEQLSRGELQEHLRAAVDEAMVEMAKSKDAILQFLDNPEQGALLEPVPSQLHAVAGVLGLLEIPEAGQLLTSLVPYVQELASGERSVPDDTERDALADVVIGAEAYMQTAIETGSGGRERIMAYAQTALDKLGLADKTAAAGESAAEAEPEAGPVAEIAEDTQTTAADQRAVEAAASAEPVGPATQDETPEAVETAEEAAVAVTETGTEGPAVEETVAKSEPELEPEPEPDVETIDSEILEVFAEEAAEELASIQENYPKWRENSEDADALTTMRRSFHTLKGSGRLVGATNIGEFAWSIENLLNRVIDGTVEAGSPLMQLMTEAVNVLPQLVAESGQLGAGGTDVSSLSERAFALAAGEVPAESPEVVAEELGTEPAETAKVIEFEPVEELVDTPAPSVADSASEQTAGAEAEEKALEAADIGAEPEPEQETADESILTATEAEDSSFSELESSGGDSSLYSVFLGEARGHLDVLAGFVARSRDKKKGLPFDEALRRAMHTLRGSSRTAGVMPMAELAGALEDYSNVMAGLQRKADAHAEDLLERSQHALLQLAAGVDDPNLAEPDWQSLRDEIRHELEELGHEHDVHSLEAQTAVAEQQADETVDPELLEIFLEEAKELLEALDTELADWVGAAGDIEPVIKLQRSLHTMKGGARLAGVTAVGDLSHALESVFEAVTERRIDDSDALKGLVRHATDMLAQDVEQLVDGQLPAGRPAMVQRLEDAAHGRAWDAVSAAEAVLGPDQVAPSESPAEPVAAERESGPEPVEPLEAQPEPARMEAVEPVEAEAAADEGEGLQLSDLDADSELAEDSQLLADSQLLTDSELLGDSSYLSSDSSFAESGLSVSIDDDSNVVHFPSGEQLGEGEGFVPRRPLPEKEPGVTTSSERVRVPSEVLDQMVNNAGEVSIYRARLEQQNTTFAFNLGELQQTIDRLRGQLRNLELETEAQILSRHERESDGPADFDPLELDRYSTMQQLSRALSETVEDLSNLGQSLNDLSRDTDTLLLQQSRVTNDLQDSLLRTRMVKFSSRVPRLERVVRQTSHSVGKQAGLMVQGGDEDMDRAILERMMGPLEHLLRNAVSHGIEDTNTRLANGKDENGQIRLQLEREGSDVVLTLSDDGAGLDRARIRAKAIERGLIEDSAVIADEDLYQLILQPGFSTAQELSQVSGRGVGMDVVLTEVKQLGGTLNIASEPGRGTTFTIRLPFTLAITDALLVTLGEEIYAIPHSSMDGVVRVPLDELRAIYAGEQDTFHYNDRDYDVRYLGSMLGAQAPHLPDGVRWMPMLLVRSGDHRVAIQVDGLLGNRQIVVKSVGAQLSTVRWFTGGTILADGQIALILDVNSLVRMMDQVQQPVMAAAEATPATKGVSVMVVDDSITVRKVTSRLLERHNMQVVTAKDGVDAVTQLQEYHPDVMLLDIEMPRMDGYELARHMRSTPELSDIPIIMITSRTGEKHRNRAMELGVKRYLGKPYQEADLLENIYTVLADNAL